MLAYNEEGNIQQMIKKTNFLCKKNFKQYEIIICDNASTDNTLSLAKRMSKKLSSIRIFSNKKNFGKFKTLMNSVNVSKGNICAFIDSDGQLNPRDLLKVIRKINEGNDICSGKRSVRKDSFYRKIFSKFFNLFNKIIFGIKLQDVNCDLKAFKKKVFQDLNLKYSAAKWFMDIEMLARAYKQNKKICEVKISHNHRKKGLSKINILSIVTETLIYGLRLKKDLYIN